MSTTSIHAGAITRQDLYDRIQTAAGGRAARLDGLILDVCRDIAAETDICTGKWEFVTEADRQEHPLPADVKQIAGVFVQRVGPLTEAFWSDWQEYRRGSGGPSRGTPVAYAWRPPVLALMPVPNRAWTVEIEYSKYHGDDVNLIELPRAAREAVVAGVLRRLYAGPLAGDEAAPATYGHWDREYYRHLRRLRADKPADPSVIPDPWS